MRRIILASLSLIVAFGVFRLGTMTSVIAFGGQDAMHTTTAEHCPMGSVCPAHFESAQWLGTIATASSLGLLIALAASFIIVLPLLSSRAYAAPAFIFTDSGPPALRSVLKKE